MQIRHPPIVPQLEDLEVTIADHIQKVMKLNFEAAWDEVGDEFQKEETFTLSTIKTLAEPLRMTQEREGNHSLLLWLLSVDMCSRGVGSSSQRLSCGQRPTLSECSGVSTP